MRLQLFLEIVEGILEAGTSSLPSYLNPVRSSVAWPNRCRAVLRVARAVIVQDIDVVLVEPVNVNQRAIGELEVVEVPHVRHARIEDGVAGAIGTDHWTANDRRQVEIVAGHELNRLMKWLQRERRLQSKWRKAGRYLTAKGRGFGVVKQVTAGVTEICQRLIVSEDQNTRLVHFDFL